MIPVAIDGITADHLRSLITNGVREGRTIEYKQVLPGGSDADKKEFLADVSSFANGAGGDLIYGITAADGMPTAVHGIDPFEPDRDVLRLESTIRDGIEPRVIGLRTRVIDEGPVLVVRIPKSWAGPHMVTFKGASRFYSRSSAGKFQMDIAELRSAFAIAGDLPQRIRAWRDDRVAKIIADDTPVPLAPAAKMILHLVPLDSLTESHGLSGTELLDRESRVGFVPIGVSGWNHRLNIDGFLTYGGRARDDDSNQERSYCQVFRSGRVEIVCSDLGHANDGTPRIASVWYEKEILEATASSLKALQTFDVHPPIVALLTLVGVKGMTLTVKPGYGDSARPIDRDVVFLPDILVEEMPRDLPRLMRPMFDAVWNACGIAQSWNFDSKGNWREGGLSGVSMEVLK